LKTGALKATSAVIWSSRCTTSRIFWVFLFYFFCPRRTLEIRIEAWVVINERGRPR